MPSLTFELTKKSPQHKTILKAVKARVQAAHKTEARSKFVQKWKKAEEKTMAYLPEREADSLRRAGREGGKPEYTTIQIPYSYAVLLSSHTYWTSVFLNRDPVYQLKGIHGEAESQVLAVESYMSYQFSKGDHLVPLHVWLYDAGKYGSGIIGTYWEEEVVYSSTIVEEQQSFGGVSFGKPKRKRIPIEMKGYIGNKLHNVRPQDFFHDPRVTLANFQTGEYCGYHTMISWTDLVQGKRSGYYMNIEEAAKIRKGTSTQRNEESTVLDLPDSGDFGRSYVEGKLAGESIPAYEFYIKIIPKDWKLGDTEHPEIWVFTVDDKYEVVLSARPLGAYHGKFPFAALELEPEGYSIYNRGIPDVTEGIQNTVDWLINTHFYNVRKTLNNEFVLDPTRVHMRDVLNPLPGGIIRLKPSAAGTDTRTAVTQLKTADVTRGHLTDMNMMFELGERVTGVNDQIMGIANPSSRRSATEIRSSNTFSVNRMKTVSEYFSGMGFTPLTRMMVQNSQQYLTSEMKLMLAGSTASLQQEKFTMVNPDKIAGFYDFIPVDGTLPVDRFAQVNLWKTLLGEMRQIPPIMAQYDIGKIFGYVAQLAGLKNVDQFKIQVVPDGMLQAQSQAGNVIPMGGEQPAKLPGPGADMGDLL